MKVLDLFSGIGGFSLGLEQAGMTTVAFCEIDSFCRAVLAQHWPGVPIYDDVRTLTAESLRRDGIAVDVICGGFPCQDLSFAGKRSGLEGERSGLWRDYARLVGELRPHFVIVENVPGLLSLGMGAVLGDLAALGYDAVWDCIPASAVGAPHRRDRVWIVAYASGARRQQVARGPSGDEGAHEGWPAQHHHVTAGHGEGYTARDVAHANGQGEHDGAEHAEVGGASEPVAYTDGASRTSPELPVSRACRETLGSGPAQPGGRGAPFRGDWWLSEPDVGRVADGVFARVDRLRSLGNAVVPQIPALIGRAIMKATEGARP